MADNVYIAPHSDAGDPKSIAHALRTDAKAICSSDAAATAARHMVGEVHDAQSNPQGVKAVVSALTDESAAVVNRRDGTVDVKAGAGCKRVNVDFAAGKVNGLDDKQWDAKVNEQLYAHFLTEGFQNVSERGRAVWAQQLLKDGDEISEKGISMDNVAKALSSQKGFSFERGTDGAIKSMTYTPKDASGSPTTVNFQDRTVNGKSEDNWADIGKQQNLAEKISKDEVRAAKGDPLAKRELVAELSGLNRDDFGKGVMADLEKTYHATLQRPDGKTDGPISEVDFAKKGKGEAIAVNLEHLTVNGETTRQLYQQEANGVLQPFIKGMDKTTGVMLSPADMKLLQQARIDLKDVKDGIVPLDPEVRDAAKKLGAAIVGNNIDDAARIMHKFVDQPLKAVELAEVMSGLPKTPYNAFAPATMPIMSYEFGTKPDRSGHVDMPRGAYFQLHSGGERILFGHHEPKVMVQLPTYRGEEPHYATAKATTVAWARDAFSKIARQQVEPELSRPLAYTKFEKQ